MPPNVTPPEVRFWRTTALIALVIAVVLALLNIMLRRGERPSNAPAPAVPGAATTPDLEGQHRPWGRLLTEAIVLERPPEMLRAIEHCLDNSPAWFFGNTAPEQIEELFRKADLPAEARAWLLDRGNWRRLSDGVAIEPADQLLLEMSAATREKVYSFLAHIPGNPFKNDPFSITTNLLDSWLADDQLSEETRGLIRSLLYRRNSLVCFSDPGLLGGRISAAERRPVLNVLSRMPARRAFLQIRAGDDLGAITNYWGRAGRMDAMLPLLDSLRRSGRGAQMDISYLLPGFARERLYTFPQATTSPQGSVMDCYWTALNFDRTPPEKPFIEPASRARHIEENFQLITTEPLLGDIMVLYGASREPLHACVYIAGDLVFTKNGSTALSPWVLMAYPEMLAYYSAGGPPTLRIYRSRKGPGT